MLIYVATAAVAAGLLVANSVLANASGTVDRLLFKFVPLVLGTMLGVQTYLICLGVPF